MKKHIAALACALALLLSFSGCATLFSLRQETDGASSATQTPAPAATPDATPEPTPASTAEPTPTASPTPDPAAALQGGTWISYHETDGVEILVFELTFNPDGTMTYLAGWYYSEVAYLGSGTYTADGERIAYSLSSDAHEPAQMDGSAAYSLADGLLTLSAPEGDAFTYLLESESLTFAVKGSAQDVPPAF